MHEEQRGNDIPETLGFLFVDGVEPIHCPLRTTFCLDVGCIAKRRVCSRSRIADLSHVHDSFIVGLRKTCVSHWTSFCISMPQGLGAAGSLRFGAKEAKNFPPHILTVDDNDTSTIQTTIEIINMVSRLTPETSHLANPGYSQLQRSAPVSFGARARMI